MRIAITGENAMSRSFGPVLSKGVSFLSTVVFHLLFGGYIFMVICLVLGKPQSWGPDPDFNAALLIGALSGSYLGGVVWISHHFLKCTLSLGRRLTTMIVSGTLIGTGLLIILHYPKDWKTLCYSAVPGAVLGIFTGLISASGRNPWDLIIRGLSAKQRETKPLALVGGVALRLFCVVALLDLLYMTAVLQKVFGVIRAPADVIYLLCSVLYWGLAILIAFVSPSRWIAMLVGTLLNVMLLVEILRVGYSSDQATIVLTCAISYAFIWAIFIAGRPRVMRSRQPETAPEQNRAPVWIGER